MLDRPPDLTAAFLADAQHPVRGAWRQHWEPKARFVAINNRISQSVPHLHVHVVPRRKKDGLRGFFWPRGKVSRRSEAGADSSVSFGCDYGSKNAPEGLTYRTYWGDYRAYK